MANEKVRVVKLSLDDFFSLNAADPFSHSGVSSSLMGITAVAA